MTKHGADVRDRATMRRCWLTALRAVSSTPDSDLDILLEHVLEISPFDWALNHSVSVTKDQCYAMDKVIARRLTHEPVAYIVGVQPFWSLEFEVQPSTLIPRQDSEALIHLMQKAVTVPPQRILDLGTGTGCLLLAALSLWPKAVGVGVDVSDGACMLAARNAERNGLSDRTTFCQGNWFDALAEDTGGFDLIVSNPPYIDHAALKTLMPDVRDFEPWTALDGGADGLDAYRLITKGAPHYLRPRGALIFELGAEQRADVSAIMEAQGFSRLEVMKDLGGIERALIGYGPDASVSL